jgi:hypothetical protein
MTKTLDGTSLNMASGIIQVWNFKAKKVPVSKFHFQTYLGLLLLARLNEINWLSINDVTGKGFI